mgnify:FL=1
MSHTLHPVVAAVTERIGARSASLRADYLALMDGARKSGTQRQGMGCANLAHAFAASPASDKLAIREQKRPNLGIVTALSLIHI